MRVALLIVGAVGAAAAMYYATGIGGWPQWGEHVTVTSTRALLGGAAAPGASPRQRGTVLRDVDGDTIHVDVAGRNVTVRLLGVDTPETHDPRKPVQCYGPEASAFTAGYATGRVTLTEEPTTGDVTDRYGRTLAYVFVWAHRADLGATLLRRGYARVYAFGNRHFLRRPRYERLEAAAQAAHRGRWGACP